MISSRTSWATCWRPSSCRSFRPSGPSNRSIRRVSCSPAGASGSLTEPTILLRLAQRSGLARMDEVGDQLEVVGVGVDRGERIARSAVGLGGQLAGPVEAEEADVGD